MLASGPAVLQAAVLLQDGGGQRGAEPSSPAAPPQPAAAACALEAVAWAVVRTAVAALRGRVETGSRLGVGLSAAAVSTALVPELFCCGVGEEDGALSRRSLHREAGGPLHWSVTQLVASGERLPRLMSLTSMQLCGLLARHVAGGRGCLRGSLLLFAMIPAVVVSA